MRISLALLVAATGIAGARVAREAAKDEPIAKQIDEPYAPSKAMAPIVTIGYREMAADLLFVRLAGYFGGTDSTADGIAGLVDAIVALDPRYHRIYAYGAPAITLARYGVDQDANLRAIAILEEGTRQFPEDSRIPEIAAGIYLHDLKTKDPVQRRRWDEIAVQLYEAASRKPGATAGVTAELVAAMQTKYGHRERAIAGLQEMLLITTDERARKRLVDKLAELSNQDADEIAAELQEQRRRFLEEWRSQRPAVPASTYILLGPKLDTGFNPIDLATGGHDFLGAKPFERLEPLEWSRLGRDGRRLRRDGRRRACSTSPGRSTRRATAAGTPRRARTACCERATPFNNDDGRVGAGTTVRFAYDAACCTQPHWVSCVVCWVAFPSSSSASC